MILHTVKSCPWIKFVYCKIGGRTIRIGPRVTVSEFQEHHSPKLQITGYTVRGRGQEVFPFSLEINLGEKVGSETIHSILLRKIGKVQPVIVFDLDP